jgi:RimJ/RimL family protein N-acetyltransferase
MKAKNLKIKKSDLKLIGRRVILRPLENSDAKNIYLNIQDIRIAKNITNIPWPYKLQDARQYILRTKKLLKYKDGFVFAIQLKGKKEAIGCISLHKVDFKHKNSEIGFWLGSAYWNRGIVTDAGRLILNFAFKKINLHRISGYVFTENKASQRVLEKMGFRKEGLHRHAHQRFGQWRNEVSFGLIADDFIKK